MNFATRRWCHIKQGFTIREVLVIVVVISIWLLSVVVALTNGMKYVQKTRQKVVALNLAREWMEAIYQIRDTNWTRWAGVKDQCWLKIDPLVDEWSPRCGDDTWMTTGSYVLQRLSTWWQEYFALTWPWMWLDLSSWLSSGNLQFSLCQQTGGLWESCMWTTPDTSEGTYFREIEGLWLYLKDEAVTWWMSIVCTWWMSPWCGDARAKEFRFCSRVVYVGDGIWEVKLCGVLTNFKGK